MMQLTILKQLLTSNSGKLMKKFSIHFSLFIIIINIIACKDEPSGLGSDLLPSSDQIVLKNFNSSVDSTSISSSSYKKFINTFPNVQDQRLRPWEDRRRFATSVPVKRSSLPPDNEIYIFGS